MSNPNDAIFAALAGPSDGAADAINAFTRRKLRCLTKRGMPERSLFQRIMPPIPIQDGVPIPPWETGALLHEIIESLEIRAWADARKSARELWYELAHQQRRDRRHNRQQLGYEPYHFGMRVAARILSQIRTLEECNRGSQGQ